MQSRSQQFISRLVDTSRSHATLKPVLATAALLTLAAMPAYGATLYWDGTDTSANADGGTGTWTTTTPTNWDTTAFGGSDSGWTSGDTAVFGGATATVTVGTGGVTAGGLTFNTNSYVINAGTNGLNFSSGTNQVQGVISNNGNSAATITGTVGGSGTANVVLSSSADQRVFSLTFSGISASGWGGSTTINAGTQLTTTSTSTNINQVLNSTSGITLNGGTIQFNRANNADINAVSDSAAINVYGNSTFSVTSADAGGASAIENIGAVTLNSGQMNFGWTNNPSSGGTIVMSNFTRSGSTSALTISQGANGRFRNATVTTDTAANAIIGPWATIGLQGTAGTQLNDYAVYSGGNGTFTAANIAASAESTWSTTHATTSNYTLANAAKSAANGKLTADRNINTLRANTGEFNTDVSADSGTDVITVTGHSYADGDVLTFRNAGSNFNLVHGQPYYVINSATDTFQVSTTPGGSAVNFTGTGTAGQLRILGGVTLNGNTLGTHGILAANSGATVVGGGSGSSVTLPTTTSGNLYLTNGNASLWIDAPITDNGAGVLTLVKGGTSGNGTADVSLSGTNTYTGGTVINSGALTFRTAGSWVSGQDITFGGSGRINASVGALSGDVLDVRQGAVGYITGTSAMTFTSTTGAGKLVFTGGNLGAASLNMGSASGFTGDLQVSQAIGSNPYPSVTFSSIGDTAGSSIQYGGGQGDSNQRAIVAYDGSSALTLANRQIQIIPRSMGNNAPRRDVLMNNSANAAHKLVINQDLLNTVDRTNVEFQLDGTNVGNNEFKGVIGDSTYSASASPTLNTLSVYKNGAGKWILSGNNTFTGRLLISQGTLSVGTFNDSSTAGPLGMGTVIQLGGQEVTTPLSGGSGLAGAVVMSTSNSGTLEYTGGAASTSRTFQIGSLTSATGGGTIANNGSGALTFTATNLNDTIAGVSVARTLTLGGSNTGNNEVRGIRDNVASTGKINVAKADAGKWILGGTNTYTGTTTVHGGTLLVNGSTDAGSAVAVNNTATLGGTGTIGGATSINSGGTLSPGNSPGTLTFTGNLNVNNGSSYKFEAGDLTDVDGTLDLNDNWTLVLSGTGFQNGGSVVLFTYGTLAATPDLVPTYSFVGLGFTPGTLSLSASGGEVVLNGISVVPEPTTLGVLATGAIGLLRRRRVA